MKKKRSSAALGAAFLMGVSAVGPGFLIQTSHYSARFLLPFLGILVLVTGMDLLVKANVWSVLGVSGLRAQEAADRVLPGLGRILSVVIVFGALAFNVGNVGGAALGLQAALGLPEKAGAALAALLCAGLFLIPRARGHIGMLAVGLSAIIVAAMAVVALSHPLGPVQAVAFLPRRAEAGRYLLPMLTLLGGASGGYIPYSGAHKLLEEGRGGSAKEAPFFRRSALLGSAVSGLIRLLFFFCVMGVCYADGELVQENAVSVAGADNPAAAVFRLAGGKTGYRLFGLVLFSASIACVIGATFTAVSFINTIHPTLRQHDGAVTACLLAVSAGILLIFGGAGRLAILAGTVNGFVLPVSLGCVLLAGRKKAVVGAYRQPVVLEFTGWAIVVLSLVLAVRSIIQL